MMTRPILCYWDITPIGEGRVVLVYHNNMATVLVSCLLSTLCRLNKLYINYKEIKIKYARVRIMSDFYIFDE